MVDFRKKITDWLPTTIKEVQMRDWDELDVILFTGDAYVDHPSFGAAVIGRTIENEGIRVAIVPQPNWQDDLRDFRKLGRPRLFFGLTSGNMDSMVNHYTANIRLRSDDAYTPEGKAGARPDYAVSIYTKILKEIYPDVPVIIGGIEASMRRLTHYDYWSDSLKASILVDSNADMLVYGMGELQIKEIIRLLEKGVPFEKLKNIPQTSFLVENKILASIKTRDHVEIPSHEECVADKRKFAEAYKIIETEANKVHQRIIIQPVGSKFVVVNPQYAYLAQDEIDAPYDLPYTRLPHPRYKEKQIPAYEMIKFSLNTHRGCFGGCSFCALTVHQGKIIRSRSERSIENELKKIVESPDFKGHITDIGGPTANMYRMQGRDLHICEKCVRPSCLFPEICRNLDSDHDPLLRIYEIVRKHPAIKFASIGSGIRYDMFFDKDGKIDPGKFEYMNTLLRFHVSGRLKVAPEHTSNKVLQVMRKPSYRYFQWFNDFFQQFNERNQKRNQIVPYFISSHPGCSKIEMAELAVQMKGMKIFAEQVQDFTPVPMTLSSVMYYTGLDPYTQKPILTAISQKDKYAQRKYFFWYKDENKQQIIAELQKAGKTELITKLYGSMVGNRPVHRRSNTNSYNSKKKF